MINIQPFDESYHNEENMKIFYKLYKKAFSQDHLLPFSYDDFKNGIESKLQNTFSQITFDAYTYNYIEFYTTFLYFNLNFSPYQETPYFNMNPMTSNVRSFYILNYSIGYCRSIDDWKIHYENTKSTFNFIKAKSLKVSQIIENAMKDIEVLNDIAKKYFEITEPEKIADLKNFDSFKSDISRLKNSDFSQYTKNSIIYNASYMLKYIESIKKSRDDLEVDIKKLNIKLKKVDKLKDFYLTVSGASMSLISLTIGNLSLVNASISEKHIIIFNISILGSILLFSGLFKLIYTTDDNEKDITFIVCIFIVFVLLFCLFYKLYH
jgi:hypothetical protein